jgi:lysophospholipase L1-like esterase
MRIFLTFLLVGLFTMACSQTDPPEPDPGNDTDTEQTPVNLAKYLALGDSYTIGESVAPTDRWPIQLVDQLESEFVTVDSTRIIATTGWTTGQLIDAVDIAALQPDWDLVSLLIGVNNQYRGRTPEEYRLEFEQLLQTSITLAGGDTSRVFVVSIPDYGYTPFGQFNQQTISQELDSFNAANREITLSYGVAYYNITDISRRGLDQPNYVASDGLHPSGTQYRAWVDSFYQMVADQVRE